MINRKTAKYDFMNLLSINDHNTLSALIKSKENNEPLINAYLSNMNLERLFDYLYHKEEFNFKKRISRCSNTYSDNNHDVEDIIFMIFDSLGITNRSFKLLSFLSPSFANKIINAYDNEYDKDVSKAYQEVKKILDVETEYLKKNDYLKENEIKANEFLIIYNLFKDKEINTSDTLSLTITSNDDDFLYSLFDYVKKISNANNHSLFHTIIKRLSTNNDIIDFDGDSINATLIHDALSNNNKTKDAIFLLKDKDVTKFISMNNMKAYCKDEDHKTKDIIRSLSNKEKDDLLNIIGIDANEVLNELSNEQDQDKIKRKIFCSCSNSGYPNFIGYYVLLNELL